MNNKHLHIFFDAKKLLTAKILLSFLLFLAKILCCFFFFFIFIFVMPNDNKITQSLPVTPVTKSILQHQNTTSSAPLKSLEQQLKVSFVFQGIIVVGLRQLILMGCFRAKSFYSNVKHILKKIIAVFYHLTFYQFTPIFLQKPLSFFLFWKSCFISQNVNPLTLTFAAFFPHNFYIFFSGKKKDTINC